ncbi:nucleotidyltransferase domain-containing protein [Virgibacillus sp. MSP4-1]|uniref:nucleotidyltransferase domain-containing protein n=1 Tax=Virgibacillus sp. MSP4-1 TaxID=2700081 RepID=UPI00137BA770|nr:nucleotidyltransferase domain-containing protein [Virgibacillus sp. MSP4-1]QHS21759.1 nucleotidyltransferase domain-containing protein [Virgibacillus sp. MSP4-1]
MYVQSFVNQLAQIYQTQLKANLIGIYLHGSLAMGCYQPGKSDIDILAVYSFQKRRR